MVVLTLLSSASLAASQAQQDHITMLFNRLLAVGHDLQEAVVPVKDFQRLLYLQYGLSGAAVVLAPAWSQQLLDSSFMYGNTWSKRCIRLALCNVW